MLTTIALELFESWRASEPGSALRLLGVGVSGLAPASQLELFTVPQTTRNRQLDATVDRIRERFGRVAVARASTLAGPGGQPARGRRR